MAFVSKFDFFKFFVLTLNTSYLIFLLASLRPFYIDDGWSLSYSFPGKWSMKINLDQFKIVDQRNRS